MGSRWGPGEPITKNTSQITPGTTKFLQKRHTFRDDGAPKTFKRKWRAFLPVFLSSDKVFQQAEYRSPEMLNKCGRTAQYQETLAITGMSMRKRLEDFKLPQLPPRTAKHQQTLAIMGVKIQKRFEDFKLPQLPPRTTQHQQTLVITCREAR